MSPSSQPRREHPLDLAEGLQLEFKRAAALKSPSGIAREVVSMLNEKGGEVWIGIQENKDGNAVDEEDIPDPEQARESLQRSLESRIQPWKTDAVEVDVVARSTGRKLLRVRVLALKPEEGPAAAMDEGARFYRRSGSRVLPMTWHEVRERFRPDGPRAHEQIPGASMLGEWRKKFELERTEYLGLALAPREPLKLSLMEDRWLRLLSDPRAAGNRLSGASYGWPNAKPTHEGGVLSVGPKDQREVLLSRTGILTFHVRLDWVAVSRGSTEGRRLHGIALLEYVVSFFRLAKAIHAQSQATGFLADFVITGAKGWKLPQYPPGSMGFLDASSPGTLWEDRRLEDYRLEQPKPIERDALLANPDRIAFELVAEFYEWSGLPPDRIPSAYDRATERFTLTD